jgi:hypothetical protein
MLMGEEMWARQVARMASEIKQKDEIIKVLMDAVNGLDGVFRYYDDTYKDCHFEVDDSGKPVDPEYYIWKELQHTRAALVKVKGM